MNEDLFAQQPEGTERTDTLSVLSMSDVNTNH